MKIKNGIKIKDFPLVSTDEKKSRLKDYLGKNLILYFSTIFLLILSLVLFATWRANFLPTYLAPFHI